MQTLYFVTRNEGKVKEVEEILGILVHPFRADLEEIQSLDLEEIVRAKVQRAFELVGKGRLSCPWSSGYCNHLEGHRLWKLDVFIKPYGK